MEYFSNSNTSYEIRMGDAIKIIINKKRKDNTWPVQNKHPGLVFFDLEKTGAPSRINTLRVNRLIKRYNSEINHLLSESSMD